MSFKNYVWSTAPVLLSLASLFWAGNFVVGRALGTGDVTLSPIALAFWRWALAFILVLALGARHAWKERAAIISSLPILMFYGLLSVALYNTLIYLGLQTTPTIDALLYQSCMPIMIFLFGGLIYRDRLSFQQITGATISTIGVVWILTEGHLLRVFDIAFGVGSLLILFGVAGNALYFSALRSRPNLHPMTFLIAIFGTGTLFLLPAWFATGAESPQNVPQTFGILYLAIFASVIALLFFNRGIALIGAARAGIFLHLMPVLGTLLSIAFLDEHPHFFHFIGISLVIGGVLAASLKPKDVDTRREA